MRITLKLLEEMNEMCHGHNAQFLVVIIPTKEMVFGEYLEHNRNIALSDVVDRLLANERLAREALFKFFDKANIRYVDTLPALRRAAGRKIYTRLASDMHPNKDGYRVIAEAVSEALTKNADPE
jgi:lysophospholipase L1-like esterase